jgi:hypothetical protein
MNIKMTSTQNGSVDGIRVKLYPAGSEHHLSDSDGSRALAKAFIAAGMAVEVIPPDRKTAQPEQPATASFFTPVDSGKSIESAPENKMLKRAYQRKAK